MMRFVMKKFYLNIVVILLFSTVCFGQANTGKKLERIFYDAIFFFNNEDFKEAANLFQQVLKEYPDNANLNFHTGMSWLNVKGQEYKAIPYLEKSTHNTTLKYRKNNFKEKKAPHHVWFYLGNAYRINNQLDKALDTYEVFQNIKNFDRIYNIRIVSDEIAACSRAKIIQDSPLNLKTENLGSPINTANADYNPVLSADENSIIYVSSQKFYESILYSKKINGLWSEPLNITNQIASDGNMFPTFLSADGTELYLVKKSRSGGDIYVSKLKNDTWSKAQALNENINTRWNESHAALSPDGNTLIFTSNRKGGYGGLDIYVSKRQEDGDWGPAVNMGNTINTPGDEDTPFFSADGKTLYFSSTSHFNMGGFDIFYTKKDPEGNWGNIINIGYPINTTDDDKFFYPSGKDNVAYMSKYNEENGLRQLDIFKVEIQPFYWTTSNRSLFDRDFYLELLNDETNEVIEILYDNNSDNFQVKSNKAGKRYTIQYYNK